jgi:heme A synthase
MTLNRFAAFSWATLVYMLGVVLWGAFVRATGSGAGCGDHWPMCNGMVVPREPELATLIEFTHRATSGVALILVLVMYVWARHAHPAGHRVRRGAAASSALIIVEALLGAGLVVFQLVADNDSAFRAVSMGLHLLNTFLLIGAITLTAWWASGAPEMRLRGHGTTALLLAVGVAGFFVLGMSGAVTALGDTIFPALTSSEAARLGISHWLLTLRIFHPLIAIAVGLYLAGAAVAVALLRPAPATRAFAAALVALYAVQIAAGFLNIYLRAPVWLQLVHLLLADLVWIALVLLAASALSVTHSTPLRRRRTPAVAA